MIHVHILKSILINTLSSYNFLPCILQPTRITEYSATLIDNIFLNDMEHHQVSGNVIHDITDHLPNFLILDKTPFVPKKCKVFKRDYSNMHERDLIEEVQSIRWENELPAGNANEIFNSFYSCISTTIDRHAPLKKLTKSEVKFMAKPWITTAIRKSIKTKNELFKIYLKHKCEYNHGKYKIYRNKLKHLIIVSKKLYFNDYFTTNLNNIKETWKGIKQLVTIKPTKSFGPSKIKGNNTLLTDPKTIANAFNNYFSTVGPNLAANIPTVNTSFHNFLSNARNPQLNSFYLNPTNSVEIEQIIGN